ncbi:MULTISPECIES: iron uptake system protein EfeO [unclassified Nocardioides]|uniref:iron uptake system protein EfeO n=1 Tax=unclassified Nocardioides TaxID=2615069 RepID=UPI0006F1E21C|nr:MULTISPECIES: iron uptake system protein EfeO [unclassified Nocardioides]KRA29650.1 PbrT family lead (Pb2+) uptake porter [Nocardioides sp. Root614]KRA88175.1 PbrT family lead (Pb2+) uptake porter [Nocardioides sp. Root682]
MRKTLLASLATLAVVPALAACTENAKTDAGGGDARALTVASTKDACDLSAKAAPAGTISFDVSNTGSDVTEFYLLAEDGLRIVGEVENIGPNLTKTLTVTVPEGKYVTACKPGMVGEGIRADFDVTRSDEEVKVSADEAQLIEQATNNYRAYVQDQTSQLLVRTQEFVELYKSGDSDDEARALYPVAREHWERIETVAESFGDLDPQMDAREADVDFAAGEKWTGWHAIEKDLWPARAEKYAVWTPDERAKYADDLLANTVELDKRVQATGKDALAYPLDSIANGSRGLLEEVATGKVTGEEEFWSRTDLWDFQANVDGARIAFEGVQPILETKDPELAEQLTTRFAELDELLDSHRKGDGFVYYDELTKDDVDKLAAAVNALSEPLSHLTAAVVS